MPASIAGWEPADMCGITGIAAIRGALDPEVRAALPAMNGAIRHRGPDGDGFFTDAHVGLGHRRLAIIDRAGGGQPIFNEDGSVAIVFNGEIYNHRVLRKELVSRGHIFRTDSDTEAIVHAYEEFGEACVDWLEGMFAFAIYDQRQRTLFIARDRLGKKPLFYAILGGVLHFASEMKAFVESPLWDGALDLDSLEGYLSLGFYLAPNTVYRHVRKLESGHWLRLRDGCVEVRKYWDVTEFDQDRRAEPAVLDELEALLRECVLERLESEVPLGAFLSGGIDSGLVVSFMSEALGEGLLTTSVGFGEAEHNELGAAGLTATRFHTRHHSEVVQPRLEELLDPVVAAFDEPFADSSAIPTYYVSRAARRHVTVALSGDGGDEVFGGYQARYIPHAVECRVRPYVPQPLAGWLGSHWPRSARLPRPLRLATVLENLSREPADAYYSDLCFLKPFEARALRGQAPTRNPRDSPVYDAVTRPYRTCPSESPLQRAQYADLKTYMVDDVLVKVDRMSMLHGLEVRCPLLDRRIVELAFKLPTERKLPDLQSKHLLKTIARRRLPPELLTLPKHGFSAPVGAWIAGPYTQAFQDDVFGPDSSVSSLLDLDLVRVWLGEQRTGTRDRSYALWAIWTLERWSRLRRGQRRAEPALKSAS